MHVHTDSSLLAVPWLPLLAAAASMGARREGCRSGSRHPFCAPAAVVGLIPATLVPTGCPGGGQAQHSPLRSSRRENAGKGNCPWQPPGPALRLAEGCWLLQPPVRGGRVFQRPPSVMLKRLRRAEEYWKRARWVLAAVADRSAGREVLLQHPSQQSGGSKGAER